MRQELANLIGIARGLELDDFDVQARSGRDELAGNFLGLRQRHRALARTYPDKVYRHRNSN